MGAIRCFPREKFEELLTSLGLTKSDEEYRGERKWKTPNGKTIWISDVSDEPALTAGYVGNILTEANDLDGSIKPPPEYGWGLP